MNALEKYNAANRAMIKKDIPTLKRILEDFEINTVAGNENWSLLHRNLVYSYEGKPPALEAIELLIRSGINVNARDCYECTPLHYAASAKSHEAIKLLLENGAEVDPVSVKSETPFMVYMKVYPMELETVKLFLKHGADPEFGGDLSPKEIARMETELPEIQKLFGVFSG